MLLRHTTDEVVERKALTINPAKTCQPVGAMYAALGIHNCLPHSHGSQGCCSYHRSVLTRHYKDPIMAGTSAFTEGASVFGGQSNLRQAFNNMVTVYTPDIIAVHTTCLSETIGDDVNQIAQKAIDDGKVPAGKSIIHCSTPSYIGSHVTGFSNMVTGIVKGLATSTGATLDQVNIIPGWVEPSDMRELKRLARPAGWIRQGLCAKWKGPARTLCDGEFIDEDLAVITPGGLSGRRSRSLPVRCGCRRHGRLRRRLLGPLRGRYGRFRCRFEFEGIRRIGGGVGGVGHAPSLPRRATRHIRAHPTRRQRPRSDSRSSAQPPSGSRPAHPSSRRRAGPLPPWWTWRA